MNHENFSDATLVLIGHGSTQSTESSAPVYQHAAELRRLNIFAEVREGFWKQEPQVGAVVKSVSTPRTFIVPLFVSDGYFSSDVIPRALGFVPGNSKLKIQNSEWTYCRAVGTHQRMTDVLRARAREVVEQFPFPHAPQPKDTSLFIAGHGTEQNENSREAIERQAEWLRARDEYASVQAIFLEEEPRIPECYTLARTKDVVVVPFFISDGMHTREDIPVLLGEPRRQVQERLAAGRAAWRNPTERNGRRVWYAAAAGTDPRVAEVILDRVREAVN